jgi:hypothetical protein
MIREISSTAKEKAERQERLRREFQKRFLASQEERKRTHYTPRPPRYDDVYFQGLAALNENEGEGMNEFVRLKLRGEAQEPKDYRVPILNTMTFKDWHLGYCLEENPFKTQRILSISHSNGLNFDSKQPFKEIPELKYIFPHRVSFAKIFQKRGFTHMYVVEK